MEDNTKAFLDKIQQLKDATSEVHMVSSGKKIQIKPLSFKQQKDLISTIADGPLGALKFQKVLNQIVLDNTDNQLLTVVDRLPIVLKLRCDAVGSKVKVGDLTIDLLPALKDSIKLKYTTSKIIKGDIEISLEIPTLKVESKIIQDCIGTVKGEGSEEFGKNIGSIYTYEIVKYVKSVAFGEDVLDFEFLPIKDRVKIVENLPISLNKKIVEFIQQIKTKEEELLTFEIDGKTKTIDIDVAFFDS